MFDPKSIDAAVNASLAVIPKDQRGVALGVVRTDGSVEVAVATRIGKSKNWDLVFTGKKDPGKKPDGLVAIRGTW